MRPKAFATLRLITSSKVLYTLPVDMAANHGAISLKLRAAMSLTRLWRGRRRVSEARKLLSSVYRRVTEGCETADLVAARALFDSIR